MKNNQVINQINKNRSLGWLRTSRAIGIFFNYIENPEVIRKSHIQSLLNKLNYPLFSFEELFKEELKNEYIN